MIFDTDARDQRLALHVFDGAFDFRKHLVRITRNTARFRRACRGARHSTAHSGYTMVERSRIRPQSEFYCFFRAHDELLARRPPAWDVLGPVSGAIWTLQSRANGRTIAQIQGAARLRELFDLEVPKLHFHGRTQVDLKSDPARFLSVVVHEIEGDLSI